MAQRTNVQAFQAELARKLAAATHAGVSADWLGVSWRGVRGLLPLAQAGEIVQPMALQRLPHTQPWVQGVASVRGGLTLVVDWVSFLGLPGARPWTNPDPDATPYWISLNPNLGVGAALCVDRLLGLRTAAELGPPDAASPPRPGVRQALRDADGALWYDIDMAAMAQMPAFQDPRQAAFANPTPP
jgi:twitching motility protein PilI